MKMMTYSDQLYFVPEMLECFELHPIINRINGLNVENNMNI